MTLSVRIVPRKRRTVFVDDGVYLQVRDHESGILLEGSQPAILERVSALMTHGPVNFTVRDRDGARTVVIERLQERARLLRENADLRLAFAVYSGRKEMWNLTDAEKDAISRAIALVDQPGQDQEPSPEG